MNATNYLRIIQQQQQKKKNPATEQAETLQNEDFGIERQISGSCIWENPKWYFIPKYNWLILHKQHR